MPLTQLNHVNLRTTQLQTMLAWYTDVLGLVNGSRPAFPSQGAWLYLGKTPVVHLVEIDGGTAIGSECDLKLEHFAFAATDEAAFVRTLQESGTRFEPVAMTSAGITQYNIRDPDGNHIHIDFPLAT